MRIGLRLPKKNYHRFEGDGYSDDWVKEAGKERLNTPKTTPEALKAQVSNETFTLFEKHGIMNKVEVEARYEIELEEYIKKIQIEGRILGDIARNHVIGPTATYQDKIDRKCSRFVNIFVMNIQSLLRNK
ncbi:MAG: hypothetical protein IPN86_17515 [Saprospiraceae bacterium]|nr:hypothetical protein [Saprospiraceae bacterium]